MPPDNLELDISAEEAKGQTLYSQRLPLNKPQPYSDMVLALRKAHVQA